VSKRQSVATRIGASARRGARDDRARTSIPLTIVQTTIVAQPARAGGSAGDTKRHPRERLGSKVSN
jgi:hypothetical protein